MTELLLYYLVAINVLSLVVYGVDKWKARCGWWRVPESVLMWLAVLGGSVGAMTAMWLFRHKTLKNKFRYGVPAILAVQLAVFFVVWCYYF